MNKNILIFSISALSLLSCNSDDDTPETEIKKYPESFILTQNGESTTTKITYNDKMQIIGYSEPNSNITFRYQDDRVVEVRENNTSVPYVLQYTNGILSGLKHYSNAHPVTYNSQQNSYSVGNLLSFGLEGKDIVYVNNVSENEKFVYDNNRKGPLYNLPDKNLFPVTLFSTFQYYYLSTRPIQSIILSNNGKQNILSSENTYDSDGYITSMTLKSSTEEVLRVEYKYLQK
ncbi:hypothetical protein EGY07_06080 [Chryseobacterium indologenes]|uniref:YD repeat-containing protein n=1 Tax=Chryseobacterium oryzae TaxID=2929799 RepID=A0ABY4BEA0_9FLAO|nr:MULTISPECIES: hypothetical protein [Chryseobacterium]AYZ35168.1 hypothetical protein EGY07_06080 [Chryseobacterium indologenes]MEB4762898.1 hypothetical protein [Chryseobacterium indologenes]UEQ78085.1 hypothetical protein J8N07_07230 [Chryseobacterium arthrosphaerae]UOE37488.1 hypothetical protein MTP08_10460 [Chryseobacterium oryzae]VXC32255.1 conserved hypothetical protein [Chryseobacterium sp. 8AT]